MSDSSEPSWGASLVRAPRAGEAVADQEPSPAALPRALGLGSPGASTNGVHRGPLWLASKVDELVGVCSGLVARLDGMEGRLDRLEAGLVDSAPTPSPTPTPTPASPPPNSEPVTALVEKVATVEERLRQLEFIPLKVTNLRRDVDQLSRDKKPAHRASAPSADTSELRAEVELLDKRISTVEDAMGAEERRDEGVYRELDSVAEFVAVRAETTAQALERIGPLESAVLELRRELNRAVSDLAAAEWDNDAMNRVEALESRVDRLYTALQHAVQPASEAT